MCCYKLRCAVTALSQFTLFCHCAVTNHSALPQCRVFCHNAVCCHNSQCAVTVLSQCTVCCYCSVTVHSVLLQRCNNNAQCAVAVLSQITVCCHNAQCAVTMHSVLSLCCHKGSIAASSNQAQAFSRTVLKGPAKLLQMARPTTYCGNGSLKWWNFRGNMTTCARTYGLKYELLCSREKKKSSSAKLYHYTLAK